MAYGTRPRISRRAFRIVKMALRWTASIPFSCMRARAVRGDASDRQSDAMEARVALFRYNVNVNGSLVGGCV